MTNVSTTELDIWTNLRMGRRLLGEINSTSKSFLPRNSDDLVVLGQEEFSGSAGDFTGRIVFHLDSKASNFHVDLASAAVKTTSMYDTEILFDNLLQFVHLHDFHRTTHCQRGFKNGRIVLSPRC